VHVKQISTEVFVINWGKGTGPAQSAKSVSKKIDSASFPCVYCAGLRLTQKIFSDKKTIYGLLNTQVCRVNRCT